MSSDGGVLLELEKLSFVIHKGGPKMKFDLSGKVFPWGQLLGGAQPIIPLEGFTGHIKDIYVNFKIKGNLVECKEMLNLEYPGEHTFSDKQENFELR